MYINGSFFGSYLGRFKRTVQNGSVPLLIHPSFPHSDTGTTFPLPLPFILFFIGESRSNMVEPSFLPIL